MRFLSRTRPVRTGAFISLLIAPSLVCVILLAPRTTSAQTRKPGQTGRANPSSTRQTDAASTARRTQAVTLLLETADRARTFKDLVYRARIQMHAADALWAVDQLRAGQIFRRAWEAAKAADRAAEEEDTGLFLNAEETSFTEIRNEVLSRVAVRDPRMAEALLREMTSEQEGAKEAGANNRSRRTPWRELSPSGARRIALAYQLLNKREYDRAAQVAAPLVNEGVSGDLVEFILRLGSRAEGASGRADALYLRLLERTAADVGSDANDLLLLSARVVSPHLLAVVDEKGGLQFRSLPATRRGGTSPSEDALRKAFFNLSVSILLRSPFAGRAANPVQDRIARYFATGRLLPFFETAGPEYAQFVPGLRTQLSALGSEIETARRDALGAQFQLAGMEQKNSSDPLAPQYEQLARAGDKQERDRISAQIARRAALERLWDRAQRAAYQIENADLRRVLLSFIAVHQIADVTRAYKNEKEDDFEAVARFVRRAEVPAYASTWGLAQASTIAARRKDKTDVSALLSEAESYVARLDRGARQRIAGYIILTDAASRIEPERAWSFLYEMVRSVNAAPDYRGDELSLPTNMDASSDQTAEQLNIESDAFRLDAIFATMARLDFEKTLNEAQALTGEIPKAYATIATARAVLEKQ